MTTRVSGLRPVRGCIFKARLLSQELDRSPFQNADSPNADSPLGQGPTIWTLVRRALPRTIDGLRWFALEKPPVRQPLNFHEFFANHPSWKNRAFVRVFKRKALRGKGKLGFPGQRETGEVING